MPIVLIVVATSVWVLVDAYTIGAYGTEPWAWFFGCLLFWIIVFPVYLAKRSEIRRGAEAFAHDVMKRCPRCAEDIHDEAEVCRFCGHEFQLQ